MFSQKNLTAKNIAWMFLLVPFLLWVVDEVTGNSIEGMLSAYNYVFDTAKATVQVGAKSITQGLPSVCERQPLAEKQKYQLSSASDQ